MSHAPRVALPLLCLAAVAACGGGTTDPPSGGPTSLQILSGNNQSGEIGTALSQPLVVQVNSGADRPVEGVSVTWSVVTGGGTLGGTVATTNAEGQAQTTLTLGPAPGTNQVSASVQGASGTLNVTFVAVAESSTPGAIEVLSGNNQFANVGSELPAPLVARVQNAFSQNLVGVTVVWSVTQGGGSLATETSQTDQSGGASNTLTLGPTPGTNTVVATLQSHPALSTTFTATGVDPTPAAITITGGNDQTGMPGSQLASPLTVRVRNAAQQNLSGITVAWSVTAGGGTLESATSFTNAQGVAANTYTLGPSSGANTIRAEVATDPDLNTTFTAAATAAPGSAVVTVGDNYFEPPSVTIAVSGTVTWNWTGSPHDVTFTTPGSPANCPVANAGATCSRTFNTVGTFEYYCTLHGTSMSGSVTVVQ